MSECTGNWGSQPPRRPPMIPASWHSCPHLPPPPTLNRLTCETYRVLSKWWSVVFETRSENILRILLLDHSFWGKPATHHTMRTLKQPCGEIWMAKNLKPPANSQCQACQPQEWNYEMSGQQLGCNLRRDRARTIQLSCSQFLTHRNCVR